MKGLIYKKEILTQTNRKLFLLFCTSMVTCNPDLDLTPTNLIILASGYVAKTCVKLLPKVKSATDTVAN